MNHGATWWCKRGKPHGARPQGTGHNAKWLYISSYQNCFYEVWCLVTSIIFCLPPRCLLYVWVLVTLVWSIPHMLHRGFTYTALLNKVKPNTFCLINSHPLNDCLQFLKQTQCCSLSIFYCHINGYCCLELLPACLPTMWLCSAWPSLLLHHQAAS